MLVGILAVRVDIVRNVAFCLPLVPKLFSYSISSPSLVLYTAFLYHLFSFPTYFSFVLSLTSIKFAFSFVLLLLLHNTITCKSTMRCLSAAKAVFTLRMIIASQIHCTSESCLSNAATSLMVCNYRKFVSQATCWKYVTLKLWISRAVKARNGEGSIAFDTEQLISCVTFPRKRVQSPHFESLYI